MTNASESDAPNQEPMEPVLALLVGTLHAALAGGNLLSEYFDENITMGAISLALPSVMTQRDIPVGSA
jgi:hypothetical protein